MILKNALLYYKMIIRFSDQIVKAMEWIGRFETHFVDRISL